MNKRGVAEQILDFTKLIINFSLVLIVSVFIMIVAYNFLNVDYKTHDIESEIVAKSMIFNCLTYNNGISNQIGIIDKTKISKENLDLCFNNPNIGYKITLKDIEGNELTSAVSNSRLSDYISICKASSQYKCSIKEKYILYNEEELTPGTLKIEVITLA